MAATPLPIITLEEIKIFYETDRNLYSLLTTELWRDPLESMRVMALWLWLERCGFNNLIKPILSLPHLINEIADEAISCINYLTNSNLFTPLPEQIDFPFTQNLLSNDMSLNFIFQNRDAAILGIEKVLTDICLEALSDLLQHAIERNTTRALAETQIAMSSFIEPSFSRLNISNLNKRVNKPPGAVHPDDRTMFVTFSKGYPVPELDIREFFNLIYGDCIEYVHMQEVSFGEQPLYARIVFYMPNVIESVLNGMEKAKYTIKGRHMWMRKFVPKRRRPISPPASLLPRHGMSGAGLFQGL